MRKLYSNFLLLIRNKYAYFFILQLIFCLNSFAQSPDVGDFRSNSSGNWSDNTIWQYWDGVNWISASSGTIPNSLSSVYLESAHTITLDIDGNCKNLFVNNSEDVLRLNTQEFKLNVLGKITLYTGTITSSIGPPSTAKPIVNPPLQLINSGTNGSIKIIGESREIIKIGEFNANLRLSGWRLEIATSIDAVVSIDETIRFGNLVMSSGELNIGDDDRMFVDTDGVPANINGSVLIKSGATLRGSAGFFKSNTAPMNSFTIENGAIFFIRTALHTLAAQNVDFSGTLGLIANLGQAFPTPNNDNNTRTGAANIVNFNNLITDLSGNKQLKNDIVINGLYSKKGIANIDLNGFVLSYGSLGALEYAGSEVQTSTDIEFPASSGPSHVIINNTAGVNLHSSRIISRRLVLQKGVLRLANNNLTIGENGVMDAESFSSSSMVAINGSGELRKIFNQPGALTFPVGEISTATEYTPITIDIIEGVFGPNAYVGVKVVNERHPDNSTLDYINRYWTVSNPNISGIRYNAQANYMPEDIVGNEGNISSFIYSMNQPILVSAGNASANVISFENVTSSGDLTGANYCDIENNTLLSHSAGEGLFCIEAPAFQITGSQPSASGSISYQWQRSFNNELFQEITGEQSKDIEVTVIDVPGVYEFRRVVKSDLCNTVSISDTLRIEILPAIENNSIANTGSANLCQGEIPSLFSGTTPSGGNNEFSYNWQRRFDQGAWENVGNSQSFEEGNLTVPGIYHYRRTVSSGHCSTESEIIEINVSSLMSITGVATDAMDGAGSIDLTVSGGVAPYSYTWSNGATVEDITGLTPGTYTVQVADSYGCQGSTEFTVAQVTSVNEKEIDRTKLSIYPNPVKDQFVIKASLENASYVTISISNLNGKNVYDYQLSNITKIDHVVNISELPSGVYVLIVNVDGKSTYKKLIKN